MYYESTNELYHHGILGQKWGVRRFQYSDGTYTKKGLERYKKSEEKYNEAKSALKSAKADKKQGAQNKDKIIEARRNIRSAKKEMSKNYDKLKNDVRADRGKELYKSGKTITGTHISGNMKNFGIAVGGTIAANVAASMNTPHSRMAAGVIAAGSYAAQAVILAKGARDARDIRAYYAH